MTAALLAAAGLLVLALTGRVRVYALRVGLVDHPTERRLHLVDTPRGGGLAVVAVFYAVLALLVALGRAEAGVAGALAGGLLVSWVGWRDDRGGVRARTRLALHVVGALWAVTWLEGLPALKLGPVELPLGAAGPVLAVIGIVWFTNFFNFMDGVDGLAASETVAAGAVGGMLLMWRAHAGLAVVAWLLAACAAGFLAWNWPPARIFLGDVGSSFLGFSFGVLALASDRAGGMPIVLWIVLLGAFTFDATVTLVRRAVRGERLYQPHLNHAYQRLVRAGWTSRSVVVTVLVLNVVLTGATALGVAWPRLVPLVLAATAVLMAALYRAVESMQPMSSGMTTHGAVAREGCPPS